MSLQITQQYVFLPTQISGCRLWFDAADSTSVTLGTGSNVSQWSDKSGQGNNATGGTSPTYSGSGIVFNGTNQYLTTTYTANPSAESFFAVGAWTGTAQANYQFIGASANNGRQYGITKYAGSNTVRWFKSGVNGYADTAGVTSSQLLTTGLYESINGGNTALNGSNKSASVAISFTGTPTTNIGAGYSNAIAEYFQGTINEIVLYNRVVTTTEQQQIEGYLAWKWNLQGNLPSTHPFKTYPPFQNNYLLPRPVQGPIRTAKVTPSSQFSGVKNSISANVFTPLSLANAGNNCLFWYDAQDSNTLTVDSRFGTVSAWNDKSGNGFDLLSYSITSNGRPTYVSTSTDTNGYTYLFGNGVLNYVFPITPPQNLSFITLFIILQDSQNDASQKYAFNAMATNSFNMYDNTSGFAINTSYKGTSGINDVYFYTGVQGTYTLDLQFDSVQIPFAMYEFTIKEGQPPSIYTVNSWVNGSSSNSYDEFLPNPRQAGGALGLSVGGYYDVGTPTDPISVSALPQIYEIIGFSGAVSNSTRQQLEGYFAWKYNLRSALPSGQPYIIVPPYNT